MRGLHLGQRPTTTTGGATGRITFVVLDDVVYLTDPISGYTFEAPVTFVGPTTLPSGLITASEDTLLFHYAGGTWSAPATQVEGNAPVGGSIINDTFYVTIASVTYSMSVTATGDIPGMPPGGDTSLVVIDEVEYLRIVLPTGEVRYEQVYAVPTPDAEGGGGGGSPPSDLPYDPVLWNGSLDAATKNVLRDKFESLPAIVSPSDAPYNPVSWNASLLAPTQNAVRDIVAAGLANAKLLGAVGDGVADDTAALQSAVDAGPCYIPPGTYKITTLEIPSNAMVIGAGTATRLKSTVSGTTPIIRNKSGITARTEYVHMSDLVIEGTDGNGGTALWLNTFFSCYFSNLRLNMCRNAANTGRGLYMENQFESSFHNTFIGVSIENCDDALVMTSTNGTYSCGYNHFAALAIYQEVNSIQLLVGAGNGGCYNTFTGVLLQSNGGAGIYIDITGLGNIITSVAMDAAGPGPIVRFSGSASGNRIQFNNGFDPAKFVNSSSFLNEVTDLSCFCVAPGRSVSFADPIGDLKTYWRAAGTAGEVEFNLGNASGDHWRWVMAGVDGALLRLLVPGVDYPITFAKAAGGDITFKRPLLVDSTVTVLDEAYNASTWNGNLSVPTKNAVRDVLEAPLARGAADGTYSGTTLAGTAGDTIAFGDLVTLDKDDSRWEKVDISVAAAATGDARGLLAIAVTAGTDGSAITLLLMGVVRADSNFPGLTIGAPVYASTTGDLVVTQPVTVDHVIRIVGWALTADEIFFKPDGTWTTHL